MQQVNPWVQGSSPCGGTDRCGGIVTRQCFAPNDRNAKMLRARRIEPVPGHRLGGRSNYSVWSTMGASGALVRTDSMPFFAAAFVV